MIQVISKFRTELMGIAAIMIIFGHTIFWKNVNYGFLTPFITVGYCGVDVFLFLSGFGLYFSLNNNNSTKQFYFKRFKRIIPTFLCIMILASIQCHKIWTIEWFLNPITWFYNYWYIPFIFVLYLFFPLFYSLFNNNKEIVTILGVVILSVILLVIMISQGMTVNASPQMCSVARIPIFFMGASFASKKFTFLENNFYNAVLFILGTSILILCYKWDNLQGTKFTTYYFFILIIPGMIKVLGLLLGVMPSIVRSFFYFLGKISLELYLVHVTVMPFFMKRCIIAGMNIFFVVTISFILSVFSSYILFLFINKFLNKIYS